jgi:ubiquinone/menaquinone biosynthesis C-methylase UbiE
VLTLLLLANMAGHTADNFWDKEALVATYSNMNSDLFRPNTNKILELAEKLIHPKSGLHILDLASGTGNPAIGLAIAFPDGKIHASGMQSSTFGVMRSWKIKYVETAPVVRLPYSQTSRLPADLAPAMLQKLQSTAKELNLANLTSQVADAQDLSFAGDCSFDAVTFSWVFTFCQIKPSMP